MKCQECKYLMFDYIDLKLEPAVQAELDHHLKECPACAQKVEKLRERQEQEKLEGMFWYLFKPSGGFKRLFILGAIFTFILVMALISLKMRVPLFRIF